MSPTLDTIEGTATPPSEAGPAAGERSQLRLVIAGSVDDGKSTLVGRLLYDTKSILADQYDAIEAASLRRGSNEVDLALLTDGLRAEREQGITIDVAYRYFATAKRSFILADTPGHTQYTRNTVTGASTADAALILVDARNGVLVQTRRHAAVMSLLQVPHVVVAVNKMDAVGWDRARFEEVAADIRELAARVGLHDVRIVPISALTGQNVANPLVEQALHAGAPDTPDTPGTTPDAVDIDDAGSWYKGPSLLELFEDLDVATEAEGTPLRMPVQLVIRPRTPEHPDYRGLAGRIASGRVRVGDALVALPGGLSSVVTGIDTPTGPAQEARAGESVTILLRDELDVGRGQVLTHAGGAATQPRTLDQLVGVLCWLDERPSTPNQRVLLKIGTAVVRGLITAVPQVWDVDTQTWLDVEAGHVAQLNDIVRATVRLADPVAADDYAENPATGGFLVIDQANGATLAAGMIGDPLTTAFDPSI